jgi:hypothetical protein
VPVAPTDDSAGTSPTSTPSLDAAVLADLLGHPVGVVDVPEEAARGQMESAGMSPEYVDGALAGQAYVRAGNNAVRTDDVRAVLGREPRTYAEWAADHASAFTASGSTAA